MSFILAVDFDGTIVDNIFPKIGKPVPGAIEWLKEFQGMDAKLILFTVRSDGQKHGPVLTKARKYIEQNKIKLYGVNKNPSQRIWTYSPKPYANIYIDDAAFGCPLIHPKDFVRPCVNWDIVGPAVKHLLRQERKQ